MNTLAHLVITDTGLVIARFLNSDDAEKWAREKGECYLPFNKANREGVECPRVGEVYKA